MNVQTIEMERHVAREKLRAVRKQLHKRADEEYLALEAGYAALEKGTPLINLRDVWNYCPRHEDGRPKLAIARADRKEVHYSQWGNNLSQFSTASHLYVRGEHRMKHLIFNANIPGPFPLSDHISGYALVPMIPPEVRERKGCGASFDRQNVILWEVDAWSSTRIGSQPDRDPLLLKPLRGDLYAVLAQWDLTDLERAVMAGRRSQ